MNIFSKRSSGLKKQCIQLDDQQKLNCENSSSVKLRKASLPQNVRYLVDSRLSFQDGTSNLMINLALLLAELLE